MKVYVVARSERSGCDFIERHSSIAEHICVLLGRSSLFTVINEIIEEETEPVLLVHDDVYFNKNIIENAKKAIDILNSYYNCWGLAGNAGYACCCLGFNSSNIVRYIVDPHGGPNVSGGIIPAQSIDGNAMLLNVPLLKERGVLLPNIEGFHFYDIILSTESIVRGLGVYIIPNLLCYHKSGGSQKGFEEASKDKKISEYFSKTLKNEYLETINGKISIDSPYGKNDLPLLASEVTRRKTSIVVSIVIKTDFKRPSHLLRTIQSVKAFISSSRQDAVYECFIFSSDKCSASDEYCGIPVKHFKCDGENEKLFLISKAFSTLKSDYLWFIGDDECLFEKEAYFLTNILLSHPANSTFFVGTQHFEAQQRTSSLEWGVNADIYPKENSYSIIQEGKSIPFSGIIFPRDKVNKLLDGLIVGPNPCSVDYILELLEIYSVDFFPVLLNMKYVGIFKRDTMCKVSEKERQDSLCAQASVMQHVCLNGRSFFFHPYARSVVENSRSICEREQEINKIAFSLRNYIKIKYVFYKLKCLISVNSCCQVAIAKRDFYKKLLNKLRS